MTAEDARALNTRAADPDGAKVRLTIGLWSEGIRKAAAVGRRSVRESELNRPRMANLSAARTAALAHLVAAGFVVETVHDSRNGTSTQVSW